MSEEDIEHWMQVAVATVFTVLLLLGLASCIIDRMNRMPEPCTLACER